MQNKNIVNYLIALFKIDNPYIINDLIEDIETLNNKENLIPFVKAKMNYEKFKFLNSFEKLTAIINEFRKEHKLKLDDKTEMQVYNYSTRLLSKITNFANNLNFEIQAKGYDINNINLSKTFEKVLSDKDMDICKIIGFRAVYALAINNVPKLEDEIEKIVTKKAMEKMYPRLAKKSDDKKLIERLKDAN